LHASRLDIRLGRDKRRTLHAGSCALYERQRCFSSTCQRQWFTTACSIARTHVCSRPWTNFATEQYMRNQIRRGTTRDISCLWRRHAKQSSLAFPVYLIDHTRPRLPSSFGHHGASRECPFFSYLHCRSTPTHLEQSQGF